MGVKPVDDDNALLKRSIESPAIFSQIFERHAAPLSSYFHRRLDSADAEDALAETFRIAFEKRESFAPASSVRNWLYGIASRLILKRKRQYARHLVAMQRLSPLSGDLGSRGADESMTFNAVLLALTKIPAGERDALLLVAWDGLSYEEVAVVQSVPVGTIRSRISRARARVREAVTEVEGEHK